MKVTGSVPNLNIELSSDPSLPERDIVNLLAFGITRAEVTTIEDGSVDKAAQVEALQALFGKALGNKLDKTTGFQVRLKASRDQNQSTTIPKVTVVRKLSDRMTATFGQSLEATTPDQDLQVDYRLLENMNLTGVWEKKTSSNTTTDSVGVDLRFRFDLK
jgi:autotransporter translocation and assembly factor TamB